MQSQATGTDLLLDFHSNFEKRLDVSCDCQSILTMTQVSFCADQMALKCWVTFRLNCTDNDKGEFVRGNLLGIIIIIILILEFLINFLSSMNN